MSGLATSGIVFAFMVGAALLGFLLRRILPEQYRSPESKEFVMRGMGHITTMAAVVLSLLIASAKNSYDAQTGEITQLAANVALLDRVLAHYGAEAQETRADLRRLVTGVIDQMWPTDRSRSGELDPAVTRADTLYDRIQALLPASEGQRTLRAEAIKIAADLARTRALLHAQASTSIPGPLLVVLVFWAAVISVALGLYAPSNWTVVATLTVSALSMSAAIFLIVELAQPFQGFIRVSSVPLRAALAHLGQ